MIVQVPTQIVTPRRNVQRVAMDDVMRYAPPWRSEREALREFMPVRFGLGSRVGLGVRAGEGDAFLPTDISGLVAWYDAAQGITLNATRVSGWADQSGTGDANKHLAQATAGIQPLYTASDANLNGKPSLTFDKTRGDHIKSGTFTTPMAQPRTMVVIGYLASYHTSGTCISDGAAFNYIYCTGTELRYSSGSPEAVIGARTTAPFAFAYGVVASGTSSKFYRTARTASNITTGTGNALNVALGNFATPVAAYNFDGSIAEVICYSGAVAAADMGKLMTWAGAKYGITIGA